MKIWCNLLFREEHAVEKDRLRTALDGHELTFFPAIETGASGDAKTSLLDSDIAFGSPDPDVLIESINLKWAQLFSAGYTEYDRDDLRQNFSDTGKILTNSSTVFVEPCAEHLLSMMLSNARRLPDAVRDQSTNRSWPMKSIRSKSRLLLEEKVLIYGFGTIGRRLVDLLAPFSMEIIGVRRTPSPGDAVRTLTSEAADEFLPWADHVVNILPASPHTDRFFDEQRLSLLRPDATYYNIGRGTTTNTDALMAALSSAKLSAAYLDVTDPEPLPSDHPLWTTPNCHITPHTAGGAADEKHRQIEHFLNNLQKHLAGDPLVDQIA